MSKHTKNLSVELGEMELEVGFNYNPEERQTWENPGCPAEYDIHSVTIAGSDCYVCIKKSTLRIYAEVFAAGGTLENFLKACAVHSGIDVGDYVDYGVIEEILEEGDV